jgi:hypothetical protein
MKAKTLVSTGSGLSTGVLLALLACGPAAADSATTGDSARHVGLGGGGIALPGPNVSTQLNPAALASPQGIRVRTPQLHVSGDGELHHQVFENLREEHDLDRLVSIGLRLLNDRNTVWLRGEQTVRVRHWEFGLTAGGELDGNPNQLARRWFRSGRSGSPPPGARYDAQGAFYAGGVIGYGQRFQRRGSGAGALDFGARLTPMRLEYRRQTYEADLNRKVSGSDVEKERTDFGLDVGFRYAPAAVPNTTFGAVIHGINGGGLNPYTQTISLSLGAARQMSPNLMLTADWLNVTGARRFATKGAVGAEYQVNKPWLTVRGGLTTRGFAAGISIGPVNLAYTTDGQSLAYTGLSF